MLSPIELLKFGISIRTAIEKLDKKVAVIASGDLSHTLIENGPYPYNPHGREFDNLLNNCLIREGHRGACNVREANKDDDGLLKLWRSYINSYRSYRKEATVSVLSRK
ncbi:hypothetical protein [uncultured Clostridium sp.]|uniref:DODA-type extradiol aromatic ring-opening family dioxygenase n=1 Tax=uncultured Clostridium sp. TaxID=59620 RepID=UPI0025DD2029|nr:hypothetical protein [uncultured Clostridium sp.]